MRLLRRCAPRNDSAFCSPPRDSAFCSPPRDGAVIARQYPIVPKQSHRVRRDMCGFTLMEMLVASAIFSIIALALGAVFQATLLISKRLTVERVGEQAAIALADMVERREEARPLAIFKPQESGRNEWIFAGLVSEGGVQKIGEIHYWIDPEGKLLRRERVFPKVSSGDEGRVVELASSVEELEVRDLFFDPWVGRFQTEPALGVQSEEIANVPDALRIRLKYKTVDGTLRLLERIVYVKTS